MKTSNSGIDRFLELIPSELAHDSGKVLYSGRAAFSGKAPLYILGINPGGDPENYTTETVENHTRKVLTEFPDNWSAYRDEFWGNTKPGTYGMAPRILHLLQQLELDPGLVPASNLIFVRSRRENHIKKRQATLANLCWPFHDQVLTELSPKVILCLGRKAGKYVRNQIGANQLMAQFVEENNRRWKSQLFSTLSGIRVVVATHPSIANWCVPPTDPSSLVKKALA